MLNLPGIQHNIPLAPYTTYKIGGPADMFYVAHSESELVQAVTAARQEQIPYQLLGRGANVLIADKGFRGLIILNQANAISIDGMNITAESGVLIEDLIESTVSQGLSGFEHFAGIPSTLGGALWQNLHFLSPDRLRTIYISEVVRTVDILDELNTITTTAVADFHFGYDESLLRERPNYTALSATFVLHTELEDELRDRIRKNIQWRNERHPNYVELPSCGSVFKKIDQVGAGRLIEKVGLKGYGIGGIQVSEKHANFLVNRGGGTAQEVLSLIALIQKTVEKQTGYVLTPEINMLGEF